LYKKSKAISSSLSSASLESQKAVAYFESYERKEPLVEKLEEQKQKPLSARKLSAALPPPPPPLPSILLPSMPIHSIPLLPRAATPLSTSSIASSKPYQSDYKYFKERSEPENSPLLKSMSPTSATRSSFKKERKYLEKEAISINKAILEPAKSDVEHILKGNIEKILDRGDKLDNLIERTDNISKFYKNTVFLANPNNNVLLFN
jgi:hypothetical protein